MRAYGIQVKRIEKALIMLQRYLSAYYIEPSSAEIY